jgi:hypothetical protein
VPNFEERVSPSSLPECDEASAVVLQLLEVAGDERSELLRTANACVTD